MSLIQPGEDVGVAPWVARLGAERGLLLGGDGGGGDGCRRRRGGGGGGWGLAARERGLPWLGTGAWQVEGGDRRGGKSFQTCVFQILGNFVLVDLNWNAQAI